MFLEKHEEVCAFVPKKFMHIYRVLRSTGRLFQCYPNAYSFDVVSCGEAAAARNVPVRNELKHILLSTSKGMCIVHVPGDRRVSLRSVKRHLAVKQAKLAYLNEIQGDPRYSPGIICPFVEPFWSMHHLIDVSVLDNRWMTTNDGTLRGYLVFDPRLLGGASDVCFGEFSK